MKKYGWKRSWDAKGLTASVAVKTLEKVKEKYGELTPENLVEHSQNPKSYLHPLFEWDDNKAAHAHRLQQARLIINNVEITIISNGESKNIGAYEIVRTESDSGYKNIETFTRSDVEYVKESTLKAMQQLSSKMKAYREFDSIVFELDKVTKKLERTQVMVHANP